MTMGKNIKIDPAKLRAKILEKHKNVFQFCSTFSVDQVTISNILTGRTKSLRSETVVKLSGYLECNQSDLVLEEGPPLVVDSD
jgi:DNA-binding Xre family transcriptional regulator